jgi:prepilin-type N-terminal cleavage/methylation domain-containing protein
LQFPSQNQNRFSGGQTLAFFNKSTGFTLVEVLVALVILSISLLALAGLMVYSTKNNAFGGHMTEAATFAQDKLEELRGGSWVAITSGTDTKQAVKGTGTDFARSWVVLTNDSGTLRSITLRVSWNDGINRSIMFLSTVTK